MKFRECLHHHQDRINQSVYGKGAQRGTKSAPTNTLYITKILNQWHMHPQGHFWLIYENLEYAIPDWISLPYSAGWSPNNGGFLWRLLGLPPASTKIFENKGAMSTLWSAASNPHWLIKESESTAPSPIYWLKELCIKAFKVLPITRQRQILARLPSYTTSPSYKPYHVLPQIVLDTQIPPPIKTPTLTEPKDISLERLSTKIEKRIYLLLSPIDKNISYHLVPHLCVSRALKGAAPPHTRSDPASHGFSHELHRRAKTTQQLAFCKRITCC